MEAERILVIILATTLAVLLALSIVVVIKILLITNRIKKIADRIDRVTDRADAVVDILKSTAGPFVLGKLIAKFTKTAMRKKTSSKKGR